MKLARFFRHPAFLSFAVLVFPFAGAGSAEPRASLVSGLPFSPGDTANGFSRFGDATPDGRFVAITSTANNLHAGDVDVNADQDVYLLDRSSGAWQLISHRFGDTGWSAAGRSVAKKLSADGRFVLFESKATNLLATPQAPSVDYQVYLYDRSSATTTLISHALGQNEAGVSGGARAAAISADGGWVLFASSSADLIAGSGSPQESLYLKERSTGITRLVSHAAASPTAYANAGSLAASAELSADGRFVLFSSEATNLVNGVVDEPLSLDVFVYDRDTGASELISHHPSRPGLAAGGFASDLSADSRYVLLDSQSRLQSGMVNGNGLGDCFLYDRQTGEARLVSRSAAAASTSGNSYSGCVGMSDDGAFIYVSSWATDLVSPFTDNNGAHGFDLYRFDRSTGDLTLVSRSVTAAGASGNGQSFPFDFPGSVSADGRYLLYTSEATDLEVGISDTPATTDLYLYDRSANGSTLVSRRGGTAVAAGTDYGSDDRTRIDADGNAFFDNWRSLATDPQADTNRTSDVYVFPPAAGQASAISAASTYGRQALGALEASFGDHGRWALWMGWLYDLVTGSNELIGHAAGLPQVPANNVVALRSIDSASRFVLFDSQATDLGTGTTKPFSQDVYLYDRSSKKLFLVSHAAGSPTVAADGFSASSWLSGDGQRVIFHSIASNLLPGGIPSPATSHLYFYDRPADQMVLLSHRHDSQVQPANTFVSFYAISSDERFLLFASNATDLVPGFVDTNGLSFDDLYLYDRLSGQATLISQKAGSPNVGGNGYSSNPIPSGDFRYVYFESAARDLAAGQDLPPGKIFYRWDRLTGANQVVTSLPVCQSTFASELHDVSLDGRLLLVSTRCSQVAGDTNTTGDVYLYDRVAAQWELVSHLPGNPLLAKGNSRGRQLSDDGRRIVYTEDPGVGGVHATAYDRLTRQEIDLRAPAFDDGALLATNGLIQVSRDGNRILLGVDDPRAAPFDSNDDPEVFLVELSRLFADGFESGSTAAWSAALP